MPSEKKKARYKRLHFAYHLYEMFRKKLLKKNYRARKHMNGFLELSKTANGNEAIL